MADNVLFETDDVITEASLVAALDRPQLTDYVATGLGLTADYAAPDVDVTSGRAFIGGYVVGADARTGVALTDSTVNYVYLVYDPSTDDSVSIQVNTTGTDPADPSLLLGTVDTGSDSTTEENRTPNFDGEHSGTFDGELVSTTGDHAGTLNGVSGSLGGSLDGAGNDIANLGSIDAEEANDIHYAQNKPGQTGGDKIQQAIDDADAEPGPNVVVIGPVGPDDVSGSTGALSDGSYAQNAWEILAAITVPSETLIIIVNAYLFLSDGADTNVFRNADLTNGNDDIEIMGLGRAIIDGNAKNQTRQSGDAMSVEWIPLRFYGVDNLELSGFEIMRPAGWSIRPENVTDVTIENLTFFCQNNVDNQDGIKIMGPAEKVTVSNIDGRTGDDVVSPDSSGQPAASCDGSGGTVQDVTIEDITADVLGPPHSVRIIAGNGHTTKNVEVSGVTRTGTGTLSAYGVQVGWQSVNTLPTPDELKNIRVSDCTLDNFDGAFNISTPCRNVTFADSTVEEVNNVVLIDGNADAENVTVENLSVRGESGAGAATLVSAIDGASAEAHFRDITLHASSYIAYTAAASSLSGVWSDIDIDTIINRPLISNNGSMDIRWGPNIPDLNSAPPGARVLSEVRANATWDPDGDGNGEIVVYDGTAWQESVDLPNWV